LEHRINPGGSGGSAGTHAPVTIDNTVGTSEDSPYTFQLADFDFSDPNDDPEDEFAAVKVISLPVHGTLFLCHDEIVLDQEIDVEDIEADLLSFVPDLNESGTAYATWSFAVVDNSSTNDTSATQSMTINVVGVDPFVYFASYELGDNQGETVEITILLSETSTEDVTVYCETVDGTAEAGVDFEEFGDYVTILAGNLFATFEINLSAQIDAEVAKNFTISMSDPANAELGEASELNFVIYATLGADDDEELSDRRDELWEEIDDRLYDTGGVEELVDQIDATLQDMDFYRQMDYWLDYQNTLNGSLNNAFESVFAKANEIITRGEEAASKCQGMKFRVLGVNTQMYELAGYLGQLIDGLNWEMEALEELDNCGSLIFQLQSLKNQLSDRIENAAQIYQNPDNYVVPPDHADIDNLNTIFVDMQSIFAVVSADHSDFEAADAQLSDDLAIQDYDDVYDLISGMCSCVESNGLLSANTAPNVSAMTRFLDAFGILGPNVEENDYYAYLGVQRARMLFVEVLEAEKQTLQDLRIVLMGFPHGYVEEDSEIENIDEAIEFLDDMLLIIDP